MSEVDAVLEEGDECPKCGGVLWYPPVENCTCHIGPPPCYRCTNQMLECPDCFTTYHNFPKPERTDQMNPSKIVFLVNESVRAVAVTYQPDDVTTTFKTFDPNIQVDDLVVVPSSTRHKATVCKVVEVDMEIDLSSPAKLDWIISRVDTESHVLTLAREDEAIKLVQANQRRKKAAELRADLFDATDEATVASLSIANMKPVEDVEVVESSDPQPEPPADGA